MYKALSIYFSFFILLISFSVTKGTSWPSESPKYGWHFTTTSDSINEGKEVQELYDKVLKEGRIVSNFSVEDIQSLPLGIINTDVPAESQVIILITGGRITPRGAFIDAYLRVPFNPAGVELLFMGKNIPVNEGGIGGTDAAKMYLSDIIYKREKEKGYSVGFEKGPENTYIVWGCNGLEQFKISGYFQLDKDNFEVDREIEKDYAHQSVRADFSVVGKDFGDIETEINFPVFRIKSLEDFSFRLNHVSVDMSETSNPDGILLNNLFSEAVAAKGPLWTGFYAEKAGIILPDWLSARTERKEFGIEHTIIDENGFTGEVALENLLSFGDGQAGGWPISVDNLYLSIFQGSLIGGGMGGKLQLPISKSDNMIKYKAMIFEGRSLDNPEQNETKYAFELYDFSVVDSDVLLAKLTLDPTSRVNILKDSKGVVAEAMLHGHISMKKDEVFDIPNIEFSNFHLLSKDPYVKSANFALTSTKKAGSVYSTPRLGPFSLSLNHLSMAVNSGRYQLLIDGGVSLMGTSQDKNLLSGTTGVRISGLIESNSQDEKANKTQRWVLEESEIERLGIESNIGVLKIKGYANFFGSGKEGYRTGFQGKFGVGLGNASKFRIDASGMFSSDGNRKFWYMDAMYTPEAHGEAPELGAFHIQRLAGGFAYNMEPTNRHDLKTAIYNQLSKFDSEEIADNEKLLPNPTGLNYSPTEKGSISAFMEIAGSPGSKKVQSIYVQGGLELQIDEDFGLSYLGIKGAVYIMPKPSEKNGEPTGSGGMAYIAYDFRSKELHAEFGVTLSTPGIGAANIYTVLHFGPTDWWVYLGTPENRISMSIGAFGGVTSYLMVGTRLEPFPPPKISLVDDWGNPSSKTFTRGGVDTETGGIAFGGAIYYVKEIPPFAIFYANLTLSAGFDIAFRDLRGIRCEGFDGEPGMHGWYASGQAWAGVYGSVGIDIGRFRMDIFSIAAGVVLTADMPNPTWMQGYIYGKYRVLGGIISGEVSYKLVLGEKCVPIDKVNGPDINIVKTIQPSENDREVDVFEMPQVLFELPIGVAIPVSEGKSSRKFKIAFDYIKLLNSNTEIDGELIWNSEKDLVAFKPVDILPPETKITLKVKAHWQEYKDGAFVNLMDGGKVAAEEKEVLFTTGPAPDYLPKNNVVYSYPQDGQYNLYRSELNQGYIKMDRPQEYLWKSSFNGSNVNFEVFFVPTPMGDTLKTPLNIDIKNARLSFDIPDKLQLENAYKFSIWRVAENAKINLDANISTSEVQAGDGERNNMVIQNKSLNGALYNADSKELYASYFRVSKYETFTKKMQSVPSIDAVRSLSKYDEYRLLGIMLNLDETFDGFELEKQGEIPQMISAHSVPKDALPNAHWIKSTLSPFLYDNYPFKNDYNAGFTIENRDVTVNGLLPLRNFRNQYYSGDLMADTYAMQDGSIETQALSNIFWYDVSYYAYKDYKELRAKMSDAFKNVANERVPSEIRAIYMGGFRPIVAGKYDVLFEYRPPGMSEPTSKAVLPINWANH
jgi:hypothetical protein